MAEICWVGTRFLVSKSNPISREHPVEEKSNDKVYSAADTHTPKANPKRWGVSRKQNSTVVSVKDRDSPNNRNQWMQMSKGTEISATEFWRQRRKLWSDYNWGPGMSIHDLSAVNSTSSQAVVASVVCLWRGVGLGSPWVLRPGGLRLLHVTSCHFSLGVQN